METQKVADTDATVQYGTVFENELDESIRTMSEANSQKNVGTKKKGNAKKYISDPKNWAEWAGVIILLIYTIVTWCLWNSQKAANQINANGYLTADRAWINIGVKAVSLDWNNVNGPTIRAVLTATNEGNSPALNVMPFLQFVIDSSSLDQNSVRKICSSLDNMRIGNTIFMKESITSDDTNNVSFADIQSYESRMSRLNNIPIKEINFYDPGVVICATYKIIGDTAWHRTGRLFDIGEMVPTKYGLQFAEPDIGVSLTQDISTLRSHYNGDYTD